MQLTDVVAQAPGIVSRIIDGEAVLVDPRQRMIRVLNPTGAHIWALIDGQHSVTDLAAMLASQYEVDTTRAQADTLAFCTDLVHRGVLVLVS